MCSLFTLLIVFSKLSQEKLKVYYKNYIFNFPPNIWFRLVKSTKINVCSRVTLFHAPVGVHPWGTKDKAWFSSWRRKGGVSHKNLQFPAYTPEHSCVRAWIRRNFRASSSALAKVEPGTIRSWLYTAFQSISVLSGGATFCQSRNEEKSGRNWCRSLRR